MQVMNEYQDHAAGGDQQRIKRSHRNEQSDERPETAVNIEMPERHGKILEEERRADDENKQREILRLKSVDLTEDRNKQNQRNDPSRDRNRVDRPERNGIGEP